MAKTDTAKHRKRQKKAVSDEFVEEDNINNEGRTEVVSSSEQIAGTEEDAPTESTDRKQEKKDEDEQDSQVDAVIEVKGSAPTVTVSWEKKNEEEGEGDDLEKRSNGSDQMTTKELKGSGAQTQAVLSADTIGCTDSAHNGSPKTKMEQEMEDIKDEQELQMDIVNEENESTPTVTATCEKKNEVKSDHNKQEDTGSKQMIGKKKTVNEKRKAHSNVETSPSKKPKLINDGFCLFVGNLNDSKTFEELRDSLENYFKTQSLLVQDIRLGGSKKHAYVDLASEMDLTKALKLNGEMMLDKPMKIAKAKVKSEDKVKVKVPAVDKKVKDARCLFLKNVPYNATKKEIQKIFRKAIAIRFPGGTKCPSKGIAFVEFKNETIARKIQQKKQQVKMQGRVLIVDFVGETNATNSSKVTKTNSDNNSAKAAVPPNNTLFVSNLSYNVTERKLKRVFQKAVNINMPQNRGKSRGFAFVEFATVADAEKALQSSQDIKIYKRTVRVHFCEMREKPDNAKVQSKTLFVMGLAEKTTAETLKMAFEGAVSTRVAVDKDTGISKGFGFVEFESEEICKAVKDTMEDCEIDGSKVTVAYAKAKSERGRQGARGGLVGCPAGQPGGRGAGQGGHRGRSGRQSKGGRRCGAGTLQDAVKEVENKG